MKRREEYVSLLLLRRMPESREMQKSCDNRMICTYVQDSIIHFLGPPTRTCPQTVQNAPYPSHPFPPPMPVVEVEQQSSGEGHQQS